jgi:hypothetical protein
MDKSVEYQELDQKSKEILANIIKNANKLKKVLIKLNYTSKDLLKLK